MIVETTAGKIEGFVKDDVVQFRGVPYARASRFRPPEPATPWAGVREALAYGPMAPQNPSPLEAMLGAQKADQSEDCLLLNVFTAGVDDATRPVMVWIHGGGFTAGAGSIPWYNGANLVRRGDVVVVTINYRLGILGFGHLSHLVEDLEGSGSNGLRDQIAALRWVRDNIAGFGGDPGNVTIFGESAGGMSVGTLLGTPEAKGLFHGAIAQSGAAEGVIAPEVATWVTDQVLAALGLTTSTAHRLLDAPLPDVLGTQAAVDADVQASGLLAGRPATVALPFQPVVDGTLLENPPLAVVRAGEGAAVPLVVGTTADEWNLFHVRSRMGGTLDPDSLRRRVARAVGEDRADAAIALYRSARPTADLDGLFCAMASDRVFRMPAIRLAEAQLPHAPRVSMYRFDHRSLAFEGALGACHAIDIPFVFGNLERRGVDFFLGGIDQETQRLGQRCSGAWLAAARTGAPEHDDLPWPAYDLERRATCVLDRTPAVLEDPDGKLRAFWAEIS